MKGTDVLTAVVAKKRFAQIQRLDHRSDLSVHVFGNTFFDIEIVDHFAYDLSEFLIQ